jgi:small ligand-binding sensory domain FIST
MPFAASHSTEADFRRAVDATVGEIERALGGSTPDVLFVFASHAYAEHWDDLARRVCEKTGCRNLIGCTGETIVGGGSEIEAGPALSLWSAVLPGADLELFHVRFERTADGIACDGLPVAGSAAPDSSEKAIFCFGDPFTSAVDTLLEHLSDEFPGVPVMGGMASGATAPGENRLFAGQPWKNGTGSEHLSAKPVKNTHCEVPVPLFQHTSAGVVDEGVVGLIVRGGSGIRSIVSQGCRPVGTHYVVTKADRNIIYELGGVPPLLRLNELLPSLPERDQQLARQGLHLGLVINEYQASFGRGDFLISNLIGVDREAGAIAVGNLVRVGQTVQFHVRDAETADEDLRELLAADRRRNPSPPQAALLFSCNGRGTRLFSKPNHDADSVQKHCGPLPLAGFFAQGELGPVGGRNYIHGYTASIALFE